MNNGIRGPSSLTNVNTQLNAENSNVTGDTQSSLQNLYEKAQQVVDTVAKNKMISGLFNTANQLKERIQYLENINNDDYTNMIEKSKSDQLEAGSIEYKMFQSIEMDGQPCEMTFYVDIDNEEQEFYAIPPDGQCTKDELISQMKQILEAVETEADSVDDDLKNEIKNQTEEARKDLFTHQSFNKANEYRFSDAMKFIDIEVICHKENNQIYDIKGHCNLDSLLRNESASLSEEEKRSNESFHMRRLFDQNDANYYPPLSFIKSMHTQSQSPITLDEPGESSTDDPDPTDTTEVQSELSNTQDEKKVETVQSEKSIVSEDHASDKLGYQTDISSTSDSESELASFNAITPPTTENKKGNGQPLVFSDTSPSTMTSEKGQITTDTYLYNLDDNEERVDENQAIIDDQAKIRAQQREEKNAEYLLLEKRRIEKQRTDQIKKRVPNKVRKMMIRPKQKSEA